MKRIVSTAGAVLLALLLAAAPAAARSTILDDHSATLSYSVTGTPGAYVVEVTTTVVSATPSQANLFHMEINCGLSNGNLNIAWEPGKRVGHTFFNSPDIIWTPWNPAVSTYVCSSFTAQAFSSGYLTTPVSQVLVGTIP